MSRILASVMAVAFLASTSFAGDVCPIEQAMGKLPKITYKVGEASTCCAQSAQKLAKENQAEIKFVVAKKEFDDESKATLALAEATEEFVKGFAAPSTCKVSGKVTVAGKEHCCEAMAGQSAKLVEAAMKKVEMTYLVGDKTCSCPVEADTLAKKSGTEKVYLVAGEKTCCSVTARLNLARAKYKAAVEALVKTDDATDKDQS